VFVGLIVVAGLIVAVGATVRDDSTNARLTEQTVRRAPTPVRVTAPPTTSTTNSTTPAGECAVSTPHVPGGPNGFGGCWPSPDTVGVPAGVTLTAYTGPCTITAPNTVISEKTVNCDPVEVRTTGVRIERSLLHGAIDVGTHGTDPEGDDPIHLTVVDSEIDAGPPASGDWRPISASHFYVSGSYLHGTYSGAECHNACTIVDSYVHGFGSHASGMRVLRNATVTGSVIWCEPNPNSDDDNDGVPDIDGGCSADVTMYEEFGTVTNNLFERNLFVATSGWFCARQDGDNAGGIRFIDNVFQRGRFGACGRDGGSAMADFEPAGNTYTGNRFDDGTPVVPD
jgi:hypothetical protein